jgi:hypothetical protein
MGKFAAATLSILGTRPGHRLAKRYIHDQTGVAFYFDLVSNCSSGFYS